MDLNISALQTAPEKRCFPFPTMVYSACSMETGTGTLLFVIVWMTPMQKLTGKLFDAGLCQKDETQPDQLCPGIRLENK